MPRHLSLLLLVLLGIVLFFLWQCQKNDYQPSAPTTPSVQTQSDSDCVGTGCDGPTAVPGVQGCVGMGCDEPVKVPGVQGCVGMGCGKEDDSERGNP